MFHPKQIHLFLLESKNSKEPEPMGEEKASSLEYKSTTNDDKDENEAED
jgi:hypothetical protein